MSRKQLDLPVLDAIMASSARVAFTPVTTAENMSSTWGEGRTQARPYSPQARRMIEEQAHVVLAPDLPFLDAPQLNDKSPVIELFRSFGPQLPPFPVIWMEYRIPQDPTADRPWSSPLGAMINAVEPVEGSDGKFMTTILFSMLDTDGVILSLDFGVLVLADQKTGLIEDLEPIDTSLGHLQARDPDRENTSLKILDTSEVERRALALTLAEVPMRTIGLMNCRNVELQHVERPTRQPRKARRKRPDRLAYSTVVLPGTPGHSKYKGDPNAAASGVNARHTVRGHFKTFTEDAPLLGKHVGTYWWGWQARGNAEHGTVETQYDATGLGG